MKPSKGGIPGIRFRFWRFLLLYIISGHFRRWLDLTLQYAFSHSRSCRGGGHSAVALFDLTYGHHLHRPSVNERPAKSSYDDIKTEDDSVRPRLKKAAEEIYGKEFTRFFFVGLDSKDTRTYFTGIDTWEVIYMVGHVLDQILFNGAKLKTQEYFKILIAEAWNAPQPGLHPERQHDTETHKPSN